MYCFAEMNTALKNEDNHFINNKAYDKKNLLLVDTAYVQRLMESRKRRNVLDVRPQRRTGH